MCNGSGVDDGSDDGGDENFVTETHPPSFFSLFTLQLAISSPSSPIFTVHLPVIVIILVILYQYPFLLRFNTPFQTFHITLQVYIQIPGSFYIQFTWPFIFLSPSSLSFHIVFSLIFFLRPFPNTCFALLVSSLSNVNSKSLCCFSTFDMLIYLQFHVCIIIFFLYLLCAFTTPSSCYSS